MAIIDNPFGFVRSNKERLGDIVSLFNLNLEPRTVLDLRLELDQMIKDHGHWIVYRKFDRSTYSQFYDPSTGEARNGPKYAYVDTLIRVYSSLNRPSVNGEVKLPIGSADKDSNVYYMRHDINPSNMDLIIEIDKASGPRPTSYKIKQVLDIKQVDVMRDHLGRVEFFHVIAQHRTPQGDTTLM